MKNSRDSAIVYGIHAVYSLVEFHPQSVQYIAVNREDNSLRIDELLKKAKQKSIPIRIVTSDEFNSLVGDLPNAKKVHQNIMAKCLAGALKNKEEDLFLLVDELQANGEIPLFLALDGVQDPHNLGACLRSAAAFGAHAVIIPRDRSASVTDVVRKVASGAVDIVPIITVTNLARTLKMLQEKNVWIFGATEEADTVLYDADLTGALVIVLGAEGLGIRRLTKEHCDQLLQIPMSGKINSVNVSVATGIFLAEITRQRRALYFAP